MLILLKCKKFSLSYDFNIFRLRSDFHFNKWSFPGSIQFSLNLFYIYDKSLGGLICFYKRRWFRKKKVFLCLLLTKKRLPQNYSLFFIFPKNFWFYLSQFVSFLELTTTQHQKQYLFFWIKNWSWPKWWRKKPLKKTFNHI